LKNYSIEDKKSTKNKNNFVDDFVKN